MRSTPLPVRPKFEDKINVAVTREQKRRLYELAASEQATPSDLVRRALAAAFNPPQRNAA